MTEFTIPDLKVKVEPINLAVGIPDDPNQCAVADAIKSQTMFRRPKVTYNHITVSDPGNRLRYQWETPPSVRKYIKAFDASQPVKPFAVNLKGQDAVSVVRMQKTVKSKRPASVVNAQVGTSERSAYLKRRAERKANRRRND